MLWSVWAGWTYCTGFSGRISRALAEIGSSKSINNPAITKVQDFLPPLLPAGSAGFRIEVGRVIPGWG
jgi:hypothetical protein